jgi:hypothetical protein
MRLIPKHRPTRLLVTGLALGLIALVTFLLMPQLLPIVTAGQSLEPVPVGSGLMGHRFRPHSGRVVAGYRYGLKLYTHCGLASSGPDFDSSFWDPVGPESDGSGNPPPGVGNPFADGTMVLLPDGRAEFTSQSGARFLFTRHAGDKIFDICS